MQGSGQCACGRGPVGARCHLAGKQRHSAVGLHGESVVEVGLQLAHRHPGVHQALAGWLEAHLLPARLARGAITASTLHTVGDVTTAARVLRRAP